MAISAAPSKSSARLSAPCLPGPVICSMFSEFSFNHDHRHCLPLGCPPEHSIAQHNVMLTRLTLSTTRALDVRIEQTAQHVTDDSESSLVRVRLLTPLA